MGFEQIALAVNTAGTLAIGSITFLIVYMTKQKVSKPEMRNFTKRFLMVVSMLLFYTSYLMFYNQFFTQQAVTAAQYPLYILLVTVFISMIYATMSFENIAVSRMSKEEKIDKMEKQELS